MKQRFTYLLSLMLMCILGASNAVAADVYKLSFHDSSKKPGTVYLNGTVQSSSDYFSYNADKHNYNTKFNGCTYDGISYSTGLKMEGATQITWTSTEKANVTIVQSTWSEKTIKFDGNELAVADATAITGGRVYTIADVEAGDHSVTRGGGESGIFAIIVEGISSDPAALAITTDLADSYEATVGRSVTLSIKASNAQYYQWYKKLPQADAMIVGATSPSYTFTPKEEGETKFFCRVLGYNDNYVESKLTTVTAVAWQPITKARSWDFTKGGSGTAWASAQAAATSVWGGPDSSQRYNNVNALSEEELSDGTNPLKGLEGIYFTAPATKILLGGKDSSSKCLQTQGNGISALVVGCSAKDKITIRFCASGKDKTVTITSDQMDGTYVSNSTDRTNEKSASVKEDGDVVLNIPNSVRLYEIKVTPYIAVKDFELSTDAVSVEEFSTASVSAKNFAPSNYSDGTINWTSSDEAVATVNNGVITGVKAGEATITATSVDGPSKSIKVTVTATAPKNLSVEMTSNSDAAAPKVESGKTFKLTSNAQGYGFTYQWASKTSANGAWTDISGATDASYEETAVELGSKFFKVTITNAEGSASQEYEVKTVVPLEAFTVDSVNYKALDADEPQVKVRYQLVRADEETAVNLPDSVVYKGLTYAVKMIGEEAYVNNMTVVSLTNPATIEEIGARAFMFCINLTEINLNEGLKKIGDAAFFGCNGLTTVSLPGSIEYLGFKSFSECANLTDIYYDGTKEEWYELPNIEKVGIAKSVTIHFNDGTEENGKGNVVGIDNASAAKVQKDGKYFENGNIVIVKGGKKFNAAGAEMK